MLKASDPSLRPGQDSLAKSGVALRAFTIIWRLASLHGRGRKDLWSCVKAIDNRYSALKLIGKIEN